MYAKIVIFALLVGVALATDVNECEDGTPLPVEVDVVGCEEMPCELEKGSNVTMNIKIKSDRDTKTLTPKVKVHVMGLNIDYKLPEQNACNALTQGKCPIAKGDVIVYQLVMPILSIYPAVALTIDFSLLADKSEPLVCATVDAEVIG